MPSFAQFAAASAVGMAGIGLGVTVMLACFYYCIGQDDDTLELSDDGPLADDGDEAGYRVTPYDAREW